MREEIADFIDEGLDLEWSASPTGRKLTAQRWTDGILALIREEIEKAENPTKGITGIPEKNAQLFNDGFRVAKRQILALFRSDNPVGNAEL